MKVLFCVIALCMTGALGFHLPFNKLGDIKMINPKILSKMQHIQEVAKNFESMELGKQIEDINDLVDMIITEVCAFLKAYNFDPLTLPELDEDLDILNYNVHLNLTKGMLYNITSIYRDGDVGLIYEDRLLTVEVPMFFKLFTMVYDYDMKVDDYPIFTGVMNGEVFVVDVKFAVNLDFKKLQIELKSFEIPNLGNIKIRFDGDMLSGIAEALIKYVTEQFQDAIQIIATGVCKMVLDVIFGMINEILGGLKPF